MNHHRPLPTGFDPELVHYPLTQEELENLLEIAGNSDEPGERLSCKIRLWQGIQGVVFPWDDNTPEVRAKMAAVERQFNRFIRDGAVIELEAERIWAIYNS